MKIRFFSYDFDYKVKGEKVLVYLYGKTGDGTKICVIHQHRPYFFARLRNIDEELFFRRVETLAVSDAKIVRWEKVEKELLGTKEQFIKLYANYPKAVPLLSKELESWGVQCYEKDILFVHRYLRDANINPLTLVEAEGEFKENPELRIPCFYATKVDEACKEPLQKAKILALDIETYAKTKEINPHKNPILMVGFYGEDEEGRTFEKVITWKQFDHHFDYLEHVEDEAAVLRRVREIILSYKPDIITGYFSDGFDFPYLKIRADKQKIKLDLGEDHSELITSASFREGESKIRGILHLDMLKFIKYIIGKNLKTDSYSLDNVSEELLGHRKHEVNLDELADSWDNKPEKLPGFCAYNLRDAHLTFELCHKLLSDIVEFTRIVGLPPVDVTRMRFSRLVENYIMKRAMEFNVLAPNKPSNYEVEQRMDESIQGAFVFEPTPGVYKDLVVFDFRSLYPTIISAHNIGPEGFCCPCCKDTEHVPEHPGWWFCKKEKKFLPTMVEELILRRVAIKKQMKEADSGQKKMLEARSYALKILANSFYGYLSFFGARWYSLECGGSTTAYARNYIKDTIRKAEEEGFMVCYSDTDSCFLLLGDKTTDEALAFMNKVNAVLPGYMELEFEGYFPRGIFVAQKGAEKGAKKKYALIDEHGAVKITGFETVRRNWSPIAKEVQQKVLSLVLSDKADDAIAYVKDVVQQLKSGSLPTSKLIIKTQITRELDKYASTAPHVAIAQAMKARGDPVGPGTIVEYVVVKGHGLVRDRAQLVSTVTEGSYDPEYYLNNQIIPAVNSIFAVLGYKEDQIFAESTQVGLGKFMGYAH